MGRLRRGGLRRMLRRHLLLGRWRRLLWQRSGGVLRRGYRLGRGRRRGLRVLGAGRRWCWVLRQLLGR